MQLSILEQERRHIKSRMEKLNGDLKQVHEEMESFKRHHVNPILAYTFIISVYLSMLNATCQQAANFSAALYELKIKYCEEVTNLREVLDREAIHNEIKLYLFCETSAGPVQSLTRKCFVSIAR
eukprot:NP_001255065.1 Uncharacterized protein CELE_K08E5.6 [Caenorhabditis elegans]